MGILFNFLNKYKVPILIVILIILARTLFLSYYSIPSNSMYPSLESNDVVFGYHIKSEKDITTGDIYTFSVEKDGNNITMIKRLIGKPGDTISYKSSDQNFYINGEPISRKAVDLEPDRVNRIYKKHGHKNFVYFEEKLPNGRSYISMYSDFSEHSSNLVEKYLNKDFSYTLENDEYFFLGDNRHYSADSRYYGVVNYNDIKSKITRNIANREFLFNEDQRFFFEKII